MLFASAHPLLTALEVLRVKWAEPLHVYMGALEGRFGQTFNPEKFCLNLVNEVSEYESMSH